MSLRLRPPAQQSGASPPAGWGRGYSALAPETGRLARWEMAPVSREHANECSGNDITSHGASVSALDEARHIAGAIPRVPDNDRGNRNWRAVRLWAEVHSSEILRVYDAVRSKTATARLFGMRSLGPFYTACSREGRWDLVPEGRRARVGAGVLPQQPEDVSLGRQVVCLSLELGRTRRAMDALRRRLDRMAKGACG